MHIKDWKVLIVKEYSNKGLQDSLTYIKSRMPLDTAQLISLHFKYKDSLEIEQVRSQSRILFMLSDFDPKAFGNYFHDKAESILIAGYQDYDPELFWFRYTIVEASSINPDILTQTLEDY